MDEIIGESSMFDEGAENVFPSTSYFDRYSRALTAWPSQLRDVTREVRLGGRGGRS